MSLTTVNGFVFYKGYYDAILHFGQVQRGEILMAILDYAFLDKQTELKPKSSAVFNLIKPVLDANLKKYKKIKNKFEKVDEYRLKSENEKPDNKKEKEKEKKEEKYKDKEKQIVQGGQYARKNAERVGKKYISRYNYDGSRKLDWEIEAERNMPDLNSMFDTLEDFDI